MHGIGVWPLVRAVASKAYGVTADCFVFFCHDAFCVVKVLHDDNPWFFSFSRFKVSVLMLEG